MRKILAILRRDLISTTRDAMLLYIALAPIILGIAIRLFMPTVGTASINLVIIETDAAALESQLSPYAHVTVVDDRNALEQRVMAIDDAAGIVRDDQGGYRVVLQGNESHESAVLPDLVLKHAFGEQLVETEITEIVGSQIPYRDWVGAFMGLSVPFMAGMAMALFIIEDRETGMLRALNVTPLRRGAYVAARALFVVGYNLVVVYIALLAVGITNAPLGPVLAMTAVTSLGAVLFGFVVGSISPTQVAGVANLKFGFFIILLPAILYLVVPARFHVGLYWLPQFWSFKGLTEILVNHNGWSHWWPSLLWSLVTSVLLIAVTTPWLKKKLAAD